MATNTSWDRNDASQLNKTQQQATQGTQQQTTNTQGTQTSQSRTSASSAQQNMTPSALAALDALIQQLSDRPAITNEQLDSKLPLPVLKSRGSVGATFDGRPAGSTYYWEDPLTGRTLNQAEAQQLTNERNAQRQKMQEEGGIIQGGTAQMQANNLARNQAIEQLSAGLKDYTKGSAFSDAKGAMDQVLRRILEESMPAITRAAEGAGTSQSAIRGLLVNDVAARGAEGAAALGLKAAVDYGNLSTQIGSVLEGLTGADPALEALLGALGVAKGAVSNTQQSGSTTQTTTTNQTQTSNVQSQQNVDLISQILKDANVNTLNNTELEKSLNSSLEESVRF